MKFNGFIAALLGAIAVGYLFPKGTDILPLKTITNIGVGGIFFFYGLKLSAAEFKKGFYNYPVHILIQLSTFVLFPLLVLSFSLFFDGGTSSDLWLSLFFLGTLPSTVSSSIIMVSLAKGNIPTAIFNATLSGLIGVMITPLWMSIFLKNSASFDFMNVMQDLFFQVILPLSLGFFLRPLLGMVARRYSSRISFFDKSIIVLIVYSSFSSAFATSLFSSMELPDLLRIVVFVAILFFLVFFGLGLLTRAMGLSRENTITVQFSGTKKSLVHGSVMVTIIFGNTAANALFLLPVMLYHIMQLLVIAHVAQRYGKHHSEA